MAKKAAPKAPEAKAAPAPAAPAAPKKAAPTAAAAEKPAARVKSATKAEIFSQLAEKTSLTKKQVSGLFEAMDELIKKELSKKGPGLFVIPGLVKLKVVRKPATKEKQGVNPSTKEPMTIKAKPARNVVKAVPLKPLKELI